MLISSTVNIVIPSGRINLLLSLVHSVAHRIARFLFGDVSSNFLVIIAADYRVTHIAYSRICFAKKRYYRLIYSHVGVQRCCTLCRNDTRRESRPRRMFIAVEVRFPRMIGATCAIKALLPVRRACKSRPVLIHDCH